MAGAPFGSCNASKSKDTEKCIAAYEDYCRHLSEGYPKQAWSYCKDKFSLTYKTMDKYIKQDEINFPALLMEVAYAKRYMYWLEEGKKLMQGQYKYGSPVVWQTIMRNIFKDIGWDNDRHETDINPELTRQFSSLMDLLSQRQNKV